LRSVIWLLLGSRAKLWSSGCLRQQFKVSLILDSLVRKRGEIKFKTLTRLLNLIFFNVIKLLDIGCWVQAMMVRNRETMNTTRIEFLTSLGVCSCLIISLRPVCWTKKLMLSYSFRCDQIHNCLTYIFGHTLLFYLSQTWMFNKPTLLSSRTLVQKWTQGVNCYNYISLIYFSVDHLTLK
jgi:hypothetical protein